MNRSIPILRVSCIFSAFSLLFFTSAQSEAAYKLTVGVAPFVHDAATLIEGVQSRGPNSESLEDEAMPIPGADGLGIEVPELEKGESQEGSGKAAKDTALTFPDFARASLEIRKTEALVLQNYLSALLGKKGGDLIGSVVNAPSGVDRSSSLAVAVDLWIEVTVTAANAKEFAVKVSATTSTGEKLVKQEEYSQEVSKEAFFKKSRGLVEGYHKALSEVAEAIVTELKSKIQKRGFEHYENFSNIKFANHIAPEVYRWDDYMNKKGTKLLAMPMAEDRYFRETLEARLATIDLYLDYDEQAVLAPREKVYASYSAWRYRSFLAAREFIEALEEINELKKKNGREVGVKIVVPILANEVWKKTKLAEKLGIDKKNEKTQDAAVVIITLKTLLETFTIEDGRIQFDEEKLRQSDSGFAKKFTERRAKIDKLSSESHDYADKIIELQTAFSGDLAPVNMEYRGRSFTLTGQIEDRIATLQRILSEEYRAQVSYAAR